MVLHGKRLYLYTDSGAHLSSCVLSSQHISSRRHRDGMAGKPNPLLSRHKKHRGADLTVTFQAPSLILTESTNLKATKQIHSDKQEHDVWFKHVDLVALFLAVSEISALWQIQRVWKRRSIFVSPTCFDLLVLILLSLSLPSPSSSVSCLTPLLFLVYFDLLQGSIQSFGCGPLAQPLGCCCSNGRCSFVEPVGPPRGGVRATRAPSSPLARPASQPRHPKTCSGAHPHHPRADPLLPLLTHHRLTLTSQEQPLQKHTVKIQTWSTNSNW